MKPCEGPFAFRQQSRLLPRPPPSPWTRSAAPEQLEHSLVSSRPLPITAMVDHD